MSTFSRISTGALLLLGGLSGLASAVPMDVSKRGESYAVRLFGLRN
jgi:hypothetical protein